MRERVLDIVKAAVCDLNEELGYEELRQVSEETGLHGNNAGLDSLSLVSLIVDIESQVGSEFGKSVVLADEKAMSQRNSPYRSVKSLVDFIVERLADADE
jgi:acyl carrier protein